MANDIIWKRWGQRYVYTGVDRQAGSRKLRILAKKSCSGCAGRGYVGRTAEGSGLGCKCIIVTELAVDFLTFIKTESVTALKY